MKYYTLSIAALILGSSAATPAQTMAQHMGRTIGAAGAAKKSESSNYYAVIQAIYDLLGKEITSTLPPEIIKKGSININAPELASVKKEIGNELLYQTKDFFNKHPNATCDDGMIQDAAVLSFVDRFSETFKILLDHGDLPKGKNMKSNTYLLDELFISPLERTGGAFLPVDGGPYDQMISRGFYGPECQKGIKGAIKTCEAKEILSEAEKKALCLLKKLDKGLDQNKTALYAKFTLRTKGTIHFQAQDFKRSGARFVF